MVRGVLRGVSDELRRQEQTYMFVSAGTTCDTVEVMVDAEPLVLVIPCPPEAMRNWLLCA